MGPAAGAVAGRDVIAKTSQVPEGGGIILQDAGVVVTQPDAGDFKGFSDICTHMGCPVSSVSGGTINCNCHGSQYSITDGSVVVGRRRRRCRRSRSRSRAPTSARLTTATDRSQLPDRPVESSV